MKILALSDSQLGGGKNLADDRLADQEAVLERIAEIADEERVDLVLHCGDLFDSRHPSEEARLVAKRFAARAAERAHSLVVVAGNHDLRNAALASSVDLYDDCDFVRRPTVLALGDAILCCLPWCPSGQLVASRNGGDRDALNADAADLLLEVARDLRERADARPPGTPTILALHWAISGAALPNGLPVEQLREPVIPLTDLAALGFDAILAGHIHTAGLIHQAPPVLYCGSPIPCDFGEAELPHGVWLIDTEDLVPRFIPIESRALVTVDVDLTLPEGDSSGAGSPSESVLDPTDYIASAVAEHFPLTDAVVKIRYRATAEQARRVDHSALRGLCADAGVHRLYAVQPEIVRSDRARVEGVDETLGPMEALDLWIEHNDIETPGPLRSRTSTYLQEVQA